MKLDLRQTVPLAVLHAMGGHVTTRTRMMKLSFLVETRLPDSDTEVKERIDLDFYPYDYGPYSKTLVKDLRVLEAHDVITINEKTYGSTKFAYDLSSPASDAFTSLAAENDAVRIVLTTAEVVVDECGDLRVRKLLDYVYDEYPEYQSLTPFA